jgi:phage shock protein A
MPRWKPKTPREKFLAELKKVEDRITAKKAELAQLERTRIQMEAVVAALSESVEDDKGRA